MANLASETHDNTVLSETRKQTMELIHRFVQDVQKKFPESVIAFLPYGDCDTEGADMGFYLEVSADDYERAIEETSALEAEFYNSHGINFVVFPTIHQMDRQAA